MRIPLEAKDLPDRWYNVIPDLEFSVPPLMSPSGYPLGSHDLQPLAPHSIVDQELDRERRDVSIPNELHDLYAEWRPTPLFRAERFEKSIGTPARIYYKFEGGSPAGGHEANTAVPQAYFAAREGVKRIVTATGDGEWGASLATACNYFGIRCRVYMVRSSYEEKVYGRYLMEILGTEVLPSPSESTRAGMKALSLDPQSPGSLSMALSEAFDDAMAHDDTKFAWGTVMNHVLLHQTVIGLEARQQAKRAGANPDILIGAVSGGSTFGGLVFPFYQDRKRGIRMVAVETAAAPSLSKGHYTYDYGDAGQLPILLKMYTLGHSFIPPGIRAGGMRYHGMSPLISALHREGQVEARMATQGQAFKAAVAFARAEGFMPSPESSYAVKAVVDEALECKRTGDRKNILFVMDSNSNLDIASFKDFLNGSLADEPFPEDRVQVALGRLPEVKSG